MCIIRIKMEYNINFRFRNVNDTVVEFYCRMFGYQSILLSEESCEWIKNSNNERFVVSSQMEKEEVYLLMDEMQMIRHKEADVISIQQLAIDLETIAEIPECLMASMRREEFICKIKEYVKGFEKRGWLVTLNTRMSIQNELNDCLMLNEVKDISPGRAVLVLCDGGNEDYKNFYEKEKKVRRVECYWMIYFLREWLNELLLQYYHNLFEKNDIKLYAANCAWAFDFFLGKEESVTSEKIEQRKEYSSQSILKNLQKNRRFLEDVLDCPQKETLKRFNNVSKIPPIIEILPGYVKHADVEGEFLNVWNGCRKTVGVPDDYENTIWIFGGCVIFGYAVEDDGTLPSQMQKILNQKYGNKWRVVNVGTWGGNFDKTHTRLNLLPLKRGDVVVVSHAMGNVLSAKGVKCFDISRGLNDEQISSSMFWDRVIHCGRVGYAKMAELLIEKISDSLDAVTSGEKEIYNSFLPALPKELTLYIEEIRKDSGFDENKEDKRIGAVVMNCNPFTLGHRYLIEKAALMVDFLYIFVVEEDKSFFPFKERIEMVKRGTSHLKNVYVCRSGRFMISSATFPGYFQKDNPEQVDIDSTSDVEIFARMIAPTLGISVRFVGEEPNDIITYEYNQKMKEIFPQAGLELIEFSRKRFQRTVSKNTSIPISASVVRDYLKGKKFEKIKEIVPETTYQYLISHYNDNRKDTEE